MKKIALALLLVAGFTFQGCSEAADGTPSIQYEWTCSPSSIYTTDPAFTGLYYITNAEYRTTSPGTYSYSYYNSYGYYQYGSYSIYANEGTTSPLPGMSEDGENNYFELYMWCSGGATFYDWGSSALAPSADSTISSKLTIEQASKSSGVEPVTSVDFVADGEDFSNEEFEYTETTVGANYTVVHKHN